MLFTHVVAATIDRYLAFAIYAPQSVFVGHVVQNRLRVYHEKTAPVIDYYDEQGLLRRIDGTRPAAEVHDHIRAVIATLRLEEDV